MVAEPAPAPEWATALAADAAGDRAELRRLLEIRITELAAFGGRRLARTYAETITTVRATEEERAPGATGVAEAVAVGLHKLMAYKDEYEVARLHLDAAERARIEAELGGRRGHHVPPAPAVPAGSRHEAKAALRRLVQARPADAARGQGAARHAPRPVRSHRGPPDRAGARGRVPRLRGDRRWPRSHPPPTRPAWSCARRPTSCAATRRSSCAGSSASAPGRRSSWPGSRRLSRRGPRGRTRPCRRARSSRRGSWRDTAGGSPRRSRTRPPEAPPC